jgi:hypothetical protein
MLVNILDANSQPHTVAWRGQDTPDDASGVLNAEAVGGAPVPQQIVPANTLRGGFLFQNTSQSAMILYEVGTTVPGWYVPAFGYFPPNDSYPIPTGIISVAGTAQSEVGDTFTYRDWSNDPAAVTE